MEYGEELRQFIQDCPTPFQFTQVASKLLLNAGYTELHENDDWGENIPKKGFVIREKRALIAFNIGGYESSLIVGTHCDSPVLRLEPNCEKAKLNHYQGLNCNSYGGGIWTRWFDRPLRLAGCVIKKNHEIVPFDSIEPIAIIPSISPQLGSLGRNEILQSVANPIYSLGGSETVLQYVCNKLGLEEWQISGHELSLVDAYPPSIIGVNKEFLASQRIDNLTSTFSALKAFLGSEPNGTLNILTVFDFEEIGSNTSTGAKGDFMSTVLHKLLPNYNANKFNAFIARSLVVSSDNAHAVHPNYSSKHDVMHAPPMSSGIVLKKAPGVQYATDMTSSYPLKRAAEASGVPLQFLINRNDIPSGSTIGPHISTALGISTVDIGQPQLAMHSIRELICVCDVESNTKLLTEIYNNYEKYRLK